MKIQEILSRLNQPTPYKGRLDDYFAFCPCHADGAKNNRRSLRTQEKDGKILFYCFAGCRTEDIVKALGLSMSDLFTEDKTKSARRQIISTSGYTDESGSLVYQVLKYDPKDFRQRRPDGQAGWLWNMKGIQPIPYRLLELLAALKAGGIVFIAEGEKDVDNLAKIGLTATTNHGGAGKWRECHSRHFTAGAQVVILPDNDEPGRKHGQEVAAQLTARGCRVKVVELLGLPDKGDVSDWLKAGHGKDELLALAETAACWVKEQVSADLQPEAWQEPEKLEKDLPRVRQSGPQRADMVKSSKNYNRTDTGNAERLVDTFGAEFRYSYQLKKWIIWTGKRWEIDDSGVMYGYVRELSRQMQREVLEIDDTEKRKKAFEWALSLEKAGNIENCLKCAQSFPVVVVKPTMFDKDPWIFNCQNGTLNLITGELRPHRQEDYLMKISPASFDADALAPTWEKFLNRIMDGSREKIEFLKRAAGYSLTGITNEQVLFFLYGIGGNGKTVFMSPLQKILNDYHCSISTEVLMYRSDKDGGRSATPQLARLLNIRFVVASETDEGGRLSESLIKQMTGGDTLTARHLHCEPFDFVPVFKLWLYGNHKPVIRGDDEGIWRRVILIPFLAVIPDEEKDLDLAEKLLAEADGIFTWMVQGCFDWQQIGLKQPEEVASATRQYRSEMDSITNFIEECCHVAEYASVWASDIYEAYRKWCTQNGEHERSQKKFGGNLKARGFTNERSTGNRVIWRGVGLVDIPRADSRGDAKSYTA